MVSHQRNSSTSRLSLSRIIDNVAGFFSPSRPSSVAPSSRTPSILVPEPQPKLEQSTPHLPPRTPSPSPPALPKQEPEPAPESESKPVHKPTDSTNGVPSIVTTPPDSQSQDPIIDALTAPRSNLDAFVSLGIQCTLSLASVVAELAPVPYIGGVAQCLTSVFQAVEKSRVNKEQWKLLQGRCVMVIRIAGSQVQNDEGKVHINIQVAAEHLQRTLEHIVECANEWNDKSEFVAMIRFQEISDQIKGLFEELDSCLNLFSFAANVAQSQWVDVFTTVQQQELAKLDRLYHLLETMDSRMGQIANQTQEKIQEMSAELREELGKVVDQKSKVMQDENETVAVYDDAEEIIQIIRTVTKIQLPPNLLVGRQCNLHSNVPIRSGITCDIYLASFLTTEKVAKKVFRVGTTDKEAVKRYAERFMRDAELWATFKCDYTLQFYGIGMEASGRHKEVWQLYMVSPLLMNFDAVDYLKKHRDDPGMKEGILRIITDAAKGLQYLHGRNPPVVHSGMRGDNVLITDSGGGVLGGFGLTKALGGQDAPPVVMTGKNESYRWMAPEMLSSQGDPVLQTPSDVWGWAMTALELISGKVPYPHAKQMWQIMTIINAKKLPARGDYEDFAKYALKPDEMWSLLEKCWAEDPKDRPTIGTVIIELEQMLK